jgi:ABC-2 type transport system ATP-binding protein
MYLNELELHKNMEIIIDAKNLTKKYGSFIAVNKLNLQIKKGEIFGFLGHNGAGKTTTMNMLTTLLPPTEGKALISGKELTREGMEVRKLIGYVPENVQLYENLTAYENLEYFAKLSGIIEPSKKIIKVLDFLDANSYKDKKIKECSKGMRQRIGIAQGIIHEPLILFLDEPTSGLDPSGVKQLRDILKKLNKEKGMTIFLNTHLLSEVKQICTSIGVLNHGNLIYNDSLENTIKKFKNEESLEKIYLSIDKED